MASTRGRAERRARLYVPVNVGAIGYPARQILVGLFDGAFAKVQVGEFPDRLRIAIFPLVMGRIAPINNSPEQLGGLLPGLFHGDYSIASKRNLARPPRGISVLENEGFTLTDKCGREPANFASDIR